MTVFRDWGVEPVPTVVCGQSEFSSPHIPHEANPQRVGGGVKDLQWLVMDYLAERSFDPGQEADEVSGGDLQHNLRRRPCLSRRLSGV
ncbi:hypothetical protein [Halomicronema sp. CCY15110]|uniref:hypothetical protein n=1 Tax=Halomicronema sp. CCY15110 TaxID=2767773 RepID=UPI00194FAF6A|nr:hypothetical protein [Halomicronema sp. CCY15110]